MGSSIAHPKRYIICVIVNVIVLALVFTSFSVCAQNGDFYRNWKALLSESSLNLSLSFDGNHSAVWRSIDNDSRGFSMDEKFTFSPSSIKKKRNIQMKDINDWNLKSTKLLTSASYTSTLLPPTVEKSWPKQTFLVSKEPSPQVTIEESSRIYAFTKPFENTGLRGLKINKVGQNELRRNSQDFNRSSGNQNNHKNVTEPVNLDKMIVSFADPMAETSLTTSPKQTHKWSAVSVNKRINGYTNPSFNDNLATTTETEQSDFIGSPPIQPFHTAAQNVTNSRASPWNFDGQSSNLVDTKQQKTFFSWFKSMSNDTVSLLTFTQVPEAQAVVSNQSAMTNTEELTTTVSTNTSTIGHNFEFCSNDCEIKGGTCVMGNDFRPHCIVVAPDACDHFHCVNGECVSDDAVYTCECDQGWAGTFCDIPCSLNCGQYGYCSVIGNRKTVGVGLGARNASGTDDNEKESNENSSNNSITADIVCICHWNRTGANCEATRQIVPKVYGFDVPSNNFHAWQVALISILFAVTLALLCVLAPYFLWRKSWLPMRKLVYYFQEYEDDDNKDFDAFVSYKSSPRDEGFVLQHLYPKLEQELGFKLCLHFRDFPPGEAIANNIIQAVERSRRTILVLSPNYVSSEWCRLEYQKAQHEMLKLRHKIIPVILEDVRKVPEMDKALRTIIDTVTYIEWPGEPELSIAKSTARNLVASCKMIADLDRFWKLMACSMPKKRKVRSYYRDVSCDSNGLALTVVRGSAIATVPSQIPQLPMPLPPLNNVSSTSNVKETRGTCNKILDVQNEDICFSQQFAYHGTHNFFGNDGRSLRRMAENSTNSESIYTIENSTDACQLQQKGLTRQEPNRTFFCRGSHSATLDTIRDSTYSAADNSLTVPENNKTLILRKHLPKEQKDPCRLFPLTNPTSSVSNRASKNYENSALFQGVSSNNLTALTDENKNFFNIDFNNQIETQEDLFASKVSADSGIERSGDGSCCSSNRSITAEKGRSQRRAPNVKKSSEGNPSELKKSKSSDDHIVEIRNLGNKVIITPRPRTLIKHSDIR